MLSGSAYQGKGPAYDNACLPSFVRSRGRVVHRWGGRRTKFRAWSTGTDGLDGLRQVCRAVTVMDCMNEATQLELYSTALCVHNTIVAEIGCATDHCGRFACCMHWSRDWQLRQSPRVGSTWHCRSYSNQTPIWRLHFLFLTRCSGSSVDTGSPHSTLWQH